MSAPRWLSEHKAKFAELPEVRVPRAGALTDSDNEFWSDVFYFRYLLSDIAEQVYCHRMHCEPWPMELSLRMIEMENTHQVIQNLMAEWTWETW